MAQMAKTLAFSAMGGLVAGLTGCGGGTPEGTTPAGGTEGATPATGEAVTHATAKHCCKGQNECKGQSGCGVEGKHSCKGQNTCKGQGGCKGGACTEAMPAPAPVH